MRAFLVLAVLLIGFPLAPAGQAQSLFTAPDAAEEAASPSPDAAQTLVEILRDDSAREELIAQLERAAMEAEDIAPEPAPPQLSLARQIAEYTSAVAETTVHFGSTILGSLGDVAGVFTGERAVDWAELQAAMVSLALVIAVTLLFFLVLRALAQRIFRKMSERAQGGAWWAALAWLVGSSVIDALLIVLSWAGGYAFALATGTAGTMDFRQSLFLNAFLLIEMTKVVLRMIFAPRFGRLRFAPMSDETATYWYFWSSRLVSLLGYGILLIVPIVNAAVSFAVGRSLTVLIVVTALLIAVLIVLQNRRDIRAALRARHERDPSDPMGRVLAALGAIWHWFAVAYLIGLFVIWMADPGNGLQFMLMATLRSALAIVLGVVAMALITRAVAGGMHLPADWRQSLPLLEQRLNAYVPTILNVVRAIIVITVLVAIGQAWNVVDFIGWVASEVGRDMVSRVVSSALIVLIAFVLWLGISSVVEYRLNPEVGRPPTARERTLLALFRNAFMIVLVVLAVMLALSELGVNIAPLLAGAGVVGLAVGFGSQKLVQDIITGAFIQFENVINEGDFVTAGGVSGTIEHITIRSLGLRDASGTYHMIPFSSVDSVSNFMKGYAYHLAEVSVAYRENISEVKALMVEAFERLENGDMGDHLLGPLEIQGVTSLSDSSVVVRGRMKTAPGMQWAVGRAYNEVIKEVLDEAGVEIPFPHMTLYMGQGKDGTAPPLNIRQVPDATAAPPAQLPPADSPPADEADRKRRDAPEHEVQNVSDSPPSHDEADTN